MAGWPYCTSEWRTEIRPRVLARDGHRCQIRGPKCTGHASHVDHVVPVVEDPTKALDPTNCRAACGPCNQGRTQARLAAQARLNRQAATTPSRGW